MRIISCFILGYLLGGINPAYIIGRISGFDIRQHGSGNAGASNIIMLKGKKMGLFVAMFDIFKAYTAVIAARSIAPTFFFAGELAGAAAIIGHIFPIAMKFRGGKGLACLGGVILALNWRLFIGLLLSEIVLLLITKYICYVPVTASVFFPIAHAYKLGSFAPLFIFFPVTAIIVYRHTENFRRIRSGDEARINFLWDKDGELTRLGFSDEEINESDE